MEPRHIAVVPSARRFGWGCSSMGRRIFCSSTVTPIAQELVHGIPRSREAYLALAIRRVAGRPRGSVPLDLPPPADLEGLPDPKQRLREVLLSAGGPRGARRRKRFIAGFAGFRRQLAENLPLGGPLAQVPAWVRLRNDVVAVVSTWQGG